MRDAAQGLARLVGKRRQFVLFVLAGGIAALVNIVSRIALNLGDALRDRDHRRLSVRHDGCLLLGRQFVFMPSGRAVHDEYLRFALVNLVALAQVWIISVGLARFIFPAIEFTFHADTVAHVIGVIAPVFTSYLGHKHFSFQPKEP